ncbi:TPA: 30S ribosomal protein S18 [bacterium]|nr:30S ribosomal protein S18 [bacterium]
MKKKVKRKSQWFKARKSCIFCRDKVKDITYFDYERLKKEISERGKILPRRVTKNCAKHQRMITSSIKQARQLALLSYTRR